MWYIIFAIDYCFALINCLILHIILKLRNVAFKKAGEASLKWQLKK